MRAETINGMHIVNVINKIWICVCVCVCWLRLVCWHYIASIQQTPYNKVQEQNSIVVYTTPFRYHLLQPVKPYLHMPVATISPTSNTSQTDTAHTPSTGLCWELNPYVDCNIFYATKFSYAIGSGSSPEMPCTSPKSKLKSKKRLTVWALWVLRNVYY